MSNSNGFDIPMPNEESFGRKFRRKFKSDPFVPIGCVVTAGILFSGLGNFTRQASRANSVRSQKLIARVIAQGLTMAFLGRTFLLVGKVKNVKQICMAKYKVCKFNIILFFYLLIY